MKDIVIIILLSIVLIGCNKSETLKDDDTSRNQKSEMEEDKVFKPVIPNDDANAFFQEYLPITYTNYSGCHFFDRDDREEKSIAINSVNEFEKIFSCSPDMLPAIDFKSYTLIIGHFETANGGGYITEQEIVTKSRKSVLNVRWGYTSGALHTGAFTTLYYWGIYPKFESKSISMNIIYQGYI